MCGEIEKAIMLAAAAGGCRYWARVDPRARDGLLKAADAYTLRAAALLVKSGGSLIRDDEPPSNTRHAPPAWGERGGG